MKITQDEVVERQTVLHIELEEEDLGPYLDRGYRRVVNRAMIPGFRKGKAPRAVVETYLGRAALLEEALEFMLPDVTQRAIKQLEIETAGTPKFEVVQLEPFTLNATVALTPHVDLGAYRDIRVEEEKVEIGEDEVQERLDKLLNDSATWEPVERPVAMGDMVTMTVVGAVEDRDFVNETDATFVVDENNSLPFRGFAGHLEGVEAGVPKEFHVTLPDDYVDARVAGQEAHLSVSVSEIKEKKLPELSDEFARGVGDGYETLAELREASEKELKDEAEKAQKQQYRESTLDGLLKGATVELPVLLVEHEVEHLVSRRDRFVDRLNIRKDDYLRYTGKTEEGIRQEMREHAVVQLSRSWVLATLAESENLQVTEEEIETRIQTILSLGGEQAEGLKRTDLDSEEVRSSIGDTLLVDMALDRLMEIARGDGVEAEVTEQGPKDGDAKAEEGGDDGDSES